MEIDIEKLTLNTPVFHAVYGVGKVDKIMSTSITVRFTGLPAMDFYKGWESPNNVHYCRNLYSVPVKVVPI